MSIRRSGQEAGFLPASWVFSATRFIRDGASLAYVKDQIGHSSIPVTVDTSGHLMPGADMAWVDRLDVKTTPQETATPAQLAV